MLWEVRDNLFCFFVCFFALHPPAPHLTPYFLFPLHHVFSGTSSLILPPFSGQTLSLLPSHLITPHVLLSSLLLFWLPCPPLGDLPSTFLHALGHCTVQGAQSFLRFGLNNIHKEMDEVLFICCPLLCSLKPAGIDETNFIVFPWTWWNYARKIIFLVLICGPEQQAEIADFLVDVMQLRTGDGGRMEDTFSYLKSWGLC